MIGVHKVGSAKILGDHLAVQVHVAHPPARRSAPAAVVSYHAASEIVDVIGFDSSYNPADAPPVRVITVGGCAAAIDFGEAVLGVVGVAVAGVVSHVARRVVLIGRTRDAVVAVRRLMESVAGSAGDGLVGAI